MPALSIGIVTRLWTGYLRTHGPLRANRFPVKNSCGTHPASYSIDAGRFLLGAKRPEHEAYHSPRLCRRYELDASGNGSETSKKF